MCLAVYKPAGRWASLEKLKEGFRSNPDGAGYAFHDGERVVVKKGFMSFDDFWAAYKTDVFTDTEALVHFRIGTKGGKTAENCHPFVIDNGALMHNGPCLNHRCSGDKERSDTRQFAEDFIDGLESWQVERLLPMIESFAGSEKIVFMFDDGTVLIANEKNGNWKDGCWWSNFSYQAMTTRYSSHWNGSYTKSHSTWDDEGSYTPSWKEDGHTYTSNPFGLVGPEYDKVYVPSIWSKHFGRSIPKWIKDGENEPVRVWDEKFHAYVPTTLSNDALADNVVVYDVVVSDVGTVGKMADYVEVAEVLKDTEDLRYTLKMSILCTDANGTPVKTAGKDISVASGA